MTREEEVSIDMAGDARATEREATQGRHRRGSGGAGWTPVVPPAVTAHSHAVPAEIPPPREPVAYAWPELPQTGLRKFNLGTIPASVTPPRTWRRAAAFAVGTALFVVLALGLAAFTLVGKPRNGSTVDALPGPTQKLLITDLPGERVATTTGATTSQSGVPAPAGAAKPTRPRGKTPPPVQPDTTPATGRPGTSESQLAAAPVTMPPTRQTLVAVTPATDASTMGDRTEQYFALVVRNPAAAYKLTGGQLRSEGREGIEARYADIARIKVIRITIDPTSSVTRSTLLVVCANGSTRTSERQLTFSNGDDPKIVGDAPVA